MVDLGQSQPLILFPEGCTTNNTELVAFKRGAFFGLNAVKPIALKYYSPFFSPSHDILNVIA